MRNFCPGNQIAPDQMLIFCMVAYSTRESKIATKMREQQANYKQQKIVDNLVFFLLLMSLVMSYRMSLSYEKFQHTPIALIGAYHALRNTYIP